MTWLARPAILRLVPHPAEAETRDAIDWRRLRALLTSEWRGARGPAALPFCGGDVTAGSETELQAVVAGNRQHVDLPRAIEASAYYRNLLKRSAAQDTPKRALRDLQRFLEDNPSGVWENSWVRVARARLSPFARQVLERDLLADKSDSEGGRRRDAERFVLRDEMGQAVLRLPVSYLLKLSLADAVSGPDLPAEVGQTGRRLMDHFLNDNTSPETTSFHVAPLRPDEGLGRGLGRETARRFLLTQLLMQYANEQFGLRASGQTTAVYLSPHPPLRQEQLNDCISDAFYRELFISPCLSGWDRGEEKREYMELCHQVLSRSQLHTVAKVRDAGLIAGNLVVLPNVSNVSLANNGIHVSLGSRKLAALVEDRASGFGPVEEKAAGDLAIKIVEHFLPLFVGTYTAAPYRLDFADFHAERVLGFLPHELDFTHLRMLWRRWKKKARVKVLGQPISPSGYGRLDRALAWMFRLRGDFVPDFRLVDYLAAPLSTDESPALDGRLGNCDRLKRDLADQGVFDARMAFYTLYRQRKHAAHGYCGFEGRYYSQCESLEDDLGQAASLQTLVTALAYQYIAEGRVTHADIPDDPTLESERRQAFFGTAIGIPTFFVRAGTGNAFLRRILEGTNRTRNSHRYPGYVRVYNLEYRRALVHVLRRDAAALVEALGCQETLRDLEARISDPAQSAAGRLTRGVLEELNVRSPLAVPAVEFNGAAERYYRDSLRRRHLREGFQLLEADWRNPPAAQEQAARRAIDSRLGGATITDYLHDRLPEVLAERASAADLRATIHLALLAEHRHAAAAGRRLQEPCSHADDAAPVCGAL